MLQLTIAMYIIINAPNNPPNILDLFVIIALKSYKATVLKISKI